MSKKKENAAYISGMKDGARPFEKKFDVLSQELGEIDTKQDNIIKNQINFSETLEDVIEAGRENEQNLKALCDESKEAAKKSVKHGKRIDDIESDAKNKSYLCKKCGSVVSPKQLVCGKCGGVTSNFPFELIKYNIQDDCIKGVRELSKIVEDSNKPEEDWIYPELEDEFIKMKKIKKVAEHALGNQDDKVAYYKKIVNISNGFLTSLNNRRHEVAVVGTVKSGKSSLINALIGSQVASVDANPETSVLAKYRTTSNGNYIKISFYTENQWNKLWKTAKEAKTFRDSYNEVKADEIKELYLNHKPIKVDCDNEELHKLIMEWTKSESPKHFFVSEIEVGYESDSIPHEVFLVDTPGLSDPVKYRSDITRKYIRNSDWVVACIAGENLAQQPEFNFLSKVLANKGNANEKIFVVATKKDALTNNEIEKKQNEFLNRMGELYNNHSMAVSHFTFVAAECHYLTKKVLRGEKLNEEETLKLKKALLNLDLSINDISSKKEVILDYAKVNALFDQINERVLKKSRELLIKAIEEDYKKCMNTIGGIANNAIDDYDDDVETLTSEIESYQEQIDELEEIIDQIDDSQKKIHSLKKQLEAKISDAEGILIE